MFISSVTGNKGGQDSWLINHSQLIKPSGASCGYNIEKQTSWLYLLHIRLIQRKGRVLLSLRGVTSPIALLENDCRIEQRNIFGKQPPHWTTHFYFIPAFSTKMLEKHAEVIDSYVHKTSCLHPVHLNIKLSETDKQNDTVACGMSSL